MVNVAEGDYERGIISFKVDAAQTEEFLLATPGTDDSHVDTAGAGEVPLYVMQNKTAAAEEYNSCRALGTGLQFMVISEAIAVGDEVFGAANGRVSKLPAVAGNYYRVGRAHTAGTTAGDVILVASKVADKVVVE
jgi:hypothetical protein